MEKNKMVRYNFIVAKQTKTENTEKISYKVVLKHAVGHTLTFKSDDAQIFVGYPLGSIITVTVEPLNMLDEFSEEPNDG